MGNADLLHAARKSVNMLSALIDSKTANLMKEVMPDLTDKEAETLFSQGDSSIQTNYYSMDSAASVNVDGSASESEDADTRVLASSEVEHEDAETASIHSDSTDGGQIFRSFIFTTFCNSSTYYSNCFTV